MGMSVAVRSVPLSVVIVRSSMVTPAAAVELVVKMTAPVANSVSLMIGSRRCHTPNQHVVIIELESSVEVEFLTAGEEDFGIVAHQLVSAGESLPPRRGSNRCCRRCRWGD